MIYHWIVRQRVRKAFADLSAGRVKRHLKRFRPDAVLRAHDATTRGGTFHGTEDIARGFRQLFAATPEHNYRLEDIWVKGPPHDTRVAVSWTDRARRADGSPSLRRGMNRLRLVWGRLAEEDIYVFPVARPAARPSGSTRGNQFNFSPATRRRASRR